MVDEWAKGQVCGQRPRDQRTMIKWVNVWLKARSEKVRKKCGQRLDQNVVLILNEMKNAHLLKHEQRSLACVQVDEFENPLGARKLTRVH